MKAHKNSLFVDSLTLKGSKRTDAEIKEEISELDEQINELLSKLKETRAKRDALSSSLKEEENDVIPPLSLKDAAIAFSSASEKASFLLSLFSPSTEVYATRQYNQDLERAKYFPKCLNFWKDGCLKREGQKGREVCSSCSVKNYDRLTPEVLINGNFLNADVNGVGAIGIYPLKEGNHILIIIAPSILSYKKDIQGSLIEEG